MTVSLEGAFNKFQCDKSKKHRYHLVYDKLFDADEQINLLEVGVFKAESTLAFEHVLPNASIYGIDIFDRVSFDEVQSKVPNVKLVKCDSMNKQQVDKALDQFGNIQFDVIIDDGAHYFDANRKTLLNLWDSLKPGGRYIIEDVWPLHKMGLDQINHWWLRKHAHMYTRTQWNQFEDVLKQLKRDGAQILEHDHRSLSGQPDSYIIEIRKGDE